MNATPRKLGNKLKTNTIPSLKKPMPGALTIIDNPRDIGRSQALKTRETHMPFPRVLFGNAK
jgi:hypothetical protein